MTIILTDFLPKLRTEHSPFWRHKGPIPRLETNCKILGIPHTQRCNFSLTRFHLYSTRSRNISIESKYLKLSFQRYSLCFVTRQPTPARATCCSCTLLHTRGRTRLYAGLFSVCGSEVIARSMFSRKATWTVFGQLRKSHTKNLWADFSRRIGRATLSMQLRERKTYEQ